MPLCDMCKSEAEWTMMGREHIGERTKTDPPHGMDWGKECDRCGIKAMSKPELVKEVLGRLVLESCVKGELKDELYLYPNGYGSSWNRDETMDIHINTRFPRYPTNQVCQVRLKDSIRPGYLITEARIVDTSNPEDGFYGEWYEH